MRVCALISLMCALCFGPASGAEAEATNALEGLEVFQPLPSLYLRPIPIPGGQRGKSIDFRKVVLDVKLHDVAGRECTFLGMGDGRLSLRQVNFIEAWFYPGAFRSGFISEFSSAGYNLIDEQGDLFDRGGDADADYKVAARIVGVDVGYCDDYDTQTRRRYVTHLSAGLIVEWQVFDNALERVVYKTITNGSRRARLSRGEYLRSAMEIAFRLAARDLMADRGFYTLIYGDILAGWEAAMAPIGITGVEFDSSSEFLWRVTARSLVTVETRYGKSQGFVLSDEGYILTSAEMVTGLTHAEVQIGRSRKKLQGTVIRVAPLEDVALIRVAAQDLSTKPLPLRRDPVTVGTGIRIVRGHSSRQSNSSSRRSRRGTIVAIDDQEPGHTILISDIAHSNKIQGTPLLDENGNVAGIKIRDFVGERSGDEANRFLTIQDALEALRIHAMKL